MPIQLHCLSPLNPPLHNLRRRRLNPITQLLLNPPEHVVDRKPHILLRDARNMPRDILHKVLLLPRRLPKHPPQPPRLHKVLVRDLRGETRHLPNPPLMFRDGREIRLLPRGVERRRLDARAHVIRILAVVLREVHEAVALVGRVDGGLGGVRGEHLVVCADAVAGGVGVGEHPALKHGVCGGGDAGDHVGGGECGLFYVCEVVGWLHTCLVRWMD
jgi:hypothetical protein